MTSELSQSEEQRRLDAIAQDHVQNTGFTPRLVACRANLVRRVLSPGEVLDLGCADGLLTAHLASYHEKVVGVDASGVRLARAEQACSAQVANNVTFRKSLFREFCPFDGERFDAVVMSCILEHVADPIQLLVRATEWLKPGGKVVAIVPNSQSLHRRAGVLMGILPSLESLGEIERELDHHRSYNIERLRDEFRQASLRVISAGGYLLKPLPNELMAQLPASLVDAYEELGYAHPDLAAEIYVVGTPTA